MATSGEGRLSRPAEMALIERNMTNHPPVSDQVIDRMEIVRHAAKAFAATVVEHCPESRERSVAMTNAEQALMWAIASIARNQEA